MQSLGDDAELARTGAGLSECRDELPFFGEPDHPVAAGGPQVAAGRKIEELNDEVAVLGLRRRDVLHVDRLDVRLAVARQLHERFVGRNPDIVFGIVWVLLDQLHVYKQRAPLIP